MAEKKVAAKKPRVSKPKVEPKAPACADCSSFERNDEYRGTCHLLPTGGMVAADYYCRSFLKN